MFGKLNAEEIEEVLSKQLIGRIGCHADNITYVVPLSYTYDGKFIYARTFEGRKVDLMRKNPHVCFQVDTMDNMANWKSVIVWGVYEELTEEVARREALELLNKRKLPLISSETTHLSPVWPFMPDDIKTIEGLVFRIRVGEKSGRFEKNTYTP